METNAATATEQTVVADNASTNLRNVLASLQLTRIVCAGSEVTFTTDEVLKIEKRVQSALDEIERDARERKNVLAMMERRS